jgi:hypothetical protein
MRNDYGVKHQAERARRLAAMVDGEPCCRCGGPMYREEGPDLHLDHAVDGGYLGLSHARCNLVAGSHKGHAARWGAYRPRERPARPPVALCPKCGRSGYHGSQSWGCW